MRTDVGTARTRAPHGKHATYSFCDHLEALQSLGLPVTVRVRYTEPILARACALDWACASFARLNFPEAPNAPQA